MHVDAGLAGGDEERGGSKYRLLEELSEYVRLAARSRPLVLVLDEMQWVDGASWDALDHLLTQLERERLLVCLTIRDDPGQTEITERRKALERIDYYHELRLSRLTRDEVKRWLDIEDHTDLQHIARARVQAGPSVVIDGGKADPMSGRMFELLAKTAFQEHGARRAVNLRRANARANGV